MAWTDRQLPVGDEVFLDHVGYFVADLDAAAAQLARLGFQVSPLNVQYNADERGELTLAGTSNRLAMLERGFLEVLAATSASPLADQLRRALARYQGLHLVALSHADPAAQRERLVRAGFAMQPVIHLRRWIETLAGRRQLAFSVLRTGPGEMAEGRIQWSLSHTPELSWRPGVTAHPNGAVALTDLLICVADPDEAAGRYGRFSGRPVERTGGLHVIALDRGRLLIAGPATLAGLLPGFAAPDLPYIAGQAIRSADLDATRRALAAAGIRPLPADDALVCVGPADALGATLLFHAPAVAAPWAALAERRRQAAG